MFSGGIFGGATAVAFASATSQKRRFIFLRAWMNFEHAVPL
jgi:hypothetical protein